MTLPENKMPEAINNTPANELRISVELHWELAKKIAKLLDDQQALIQKLVEALENNRSRLACNNAGLLSMKEQDIDVSVDSAITANNEAIEEANAALEAAKEKI